MRRQIAAVFGVPQSLIENRFHGENWREKHSRAFIRYAVRPVMEVTVEPKISVLKARMTEDALQRYYAQRILAAC